MVQEMIDFLTASDPEIGASVAAELARQRRNIELIASENIVSEAVLVAMGTVLTNKYAEGYPGKRYYGGCQEVDAVSYTHLDVYKRQGQRRAAGGGRDRQGRPGGAQCQRLWHGVHRGHRVHPAGRDGAPPHQ